MRNLACGLLTVTAIAACGGDSIMTPTPTLCAGNGDCVNNGIHGFCTPSPTSGNKYCAFEDSTCAGGQRWAGDAGDALAGTCVTIAVPDMTVDPNADMAGVVTPHGDYHRFVAMKLHMPLSRVDYAHDLNGDGKADNQLGNIFGALGAQGFDVQAAVDTSVNLGLTIDLFKVRTVDATLADDDVVEATFYRGQSQSSPDYSGSGQFTIDTSRPGAVFLGALVSSKYRSADPVTTTTPVSVTLEIPLFGSTPIALPLNGAHLQFTGSAGGLTLGEIHGSIKNSYVQNTVIPAVAADYNATVTANPSSSTSKQLLAIFDVGDGNGGSCTNPDSTQSAPGDGKIGTCEVASNAIIQNVLAPDVQIYDSAGNYAPNPSNTAKDSLSVGIGFEAVTAGF